MPEAFVFVTVESSAFDEVLEKLKKIDEVKEIYEVMGNIDLILKVSAEDYTKTAMVVKEKIFKMKGVKQTTTILIVKRHK